MTASKEKRLQNLDLAILKAPMSKKPALIAKKNKLLGISKPQIKDTHVFRFGIEIERYHPKGDQISKEFGEALNQAALKIAKKYNTTARARFLDE